MDSDFDCDPDSDTDPECSSMGRQRVSMGCLAELAPQLPVSLAGYGGVRASLTSGRHSNRAG